MRSWLSPPDPSINYNTASDAHHEGTALWFIEGDAFNNWKASGPLLWLHGKRTEDIDGGIQPLCQFVIGATRLVEVRNLFIKYFEDGI